ncbi:hypothetical protein BVC80_9041g11 [Macleaya cordata]|uniref:Uncharacterized protein n=1 Tax=Macleaya cordata TaxID=56857 RepID=A0A200R2X7_MACCD|nr:hypothetical protein BVC80_9041g11 [Macleaya cordata]
MSKYWPLPPEAITPKVQRFLDALDRDGWFPDPNRKPPVYDLDYESDGDWSFDDDDDRKWRCCLEVQPHDLPKVEEKQIFQTVRPEQ